MSAIKKSVLSLLSASVFAFLLISCVSADSYQSTSTDEGWINEDTYRLTAAGSPVKTLTNKIQRRESAKRAAILNARDQMLEKFKGQQKGGASMPEVYKMKRIAIASEVQDAVKGGSVTSVTYDADDNIEIVYEVKAKELKNKVAVSIWGNETETIAVQPKVEAVKIQPEGEKVADVHTLDMVAGEVHVSSPKALAMGSMIYVRIDGKVVMLRVTFPMITSAKCKPEGKNKLIWIKAAKGMPVYRWNKNVPEVKS